jgi:hypothetical protein
MLQRPVCRLVTATLCMALMLTGCTGGTPEGDGHQPQRPTDTAAIVTSAETIVVDGDVTVTVPPGSASGGTLQVSDLGDTEEQAAAADSVEVLPLGPVAEVMLEDGELTGAATVAFALDQAPQTDPDTELVVVWQDDPSGWRLVPAHWDAAQSEVIAEVDHFSRGFVGHIDIDRWISDRKNDAVNFFTGRSGADAPICGDEEAARAGGIEASSDGGDRVKWCFGVHETNGRVLRVTNNTRAFTQITYPDSWRVVDPLSLTFSADSLARSLGAKVAVPTGKEARIVDGGDTLTLAISDDSPAKVTVEMSVVAWLTSTIVFAAESYLKVIKVMGNPLRDAAGRASDRAALLFGLDTAHSDVDVLIDCMKSISDLSDTDTSRLSWTTAKALMKFTTDCVASYMKSRLENVQVFAIGTLLSIAGAIYSTLSTAVHLVVTGTRELWDQVASLGGEDDFLYDINVGAYSADAFWMYRFFDTGRAVGQTGQRRDGQLNSEESNDSTSFWVGCEGEPATTTFRLNSQFEALSSTLYLDDITPENLRVIVSISADGIPILDTEMRLGDQIPVVLDVRGVAKLELTARAVNGDVCTPSSIGYGVAYDAAFR